MDNSIFTDTYRDPTSGSFRYYTFKNSIRMIITRLAGTYTTPNQLQVFSTTVPSSIRPNTLDGIWASVWMESEPNCQVKYTSYTNSNGDIEVYVSSSGTNRATIIYVLIIGIV